MFSENDEIFKKNIQQSLAIKLNESISNVNKEVSKHLLETRTSTDKTLELNEFLDFIKNFRPGKHTLKDGSIINITESEKDSIKDLFESLNTENRKRMIQEIFESGSFFKEHVEFAQQSRKLK